ncbi:MAG TPA: VOC family protein [Polyangiaceae bacterium]
MSTAHRSKRVSLAKAGESATDLTDNRPATMQPPTFGIHHLALVVSDLQAMEDFYVGVLGLPLVRRWHDAEGQRQRAVWLALGHDAFLALERVEHSTSDTPVPTTDREELKDSTPSSVKTKLTETPACHAPNAGWHLVALTINPDDREAWRQRLRRAGYPVERETDYTMYARDPERNFIALSHWPGR